MFSKGRRLPFKIVMNYTVHGRYLERKLHLKETSMHFLKTLPYIVGLFAIFWCIGIYGLFVTYKKVPRYTLAKARETVKENTRNRIKNLAFIIAPVLFWFLFGKDDLPLFFIVMGLIESLGLLIVLGDFTAARLAKKRIKELEASENDEI
jgi:hypothetical protein